MKEELTLTLLPWQLLTLTVCFSEVVLVRAAGINLKNGLEEEGVSKTLLTG